MPSEIPTLTAKQRKSSVIAKMWGEAAGLDLRRKTEDYL
jgi:hypothetical protein